MTNVNMLILSISLMGTQQKLQLQLIEMPFVLKKFGQST